MTPWRRLASSAVRSEEAREPVPIDGTGPLRVVVAEAQPLTRFGIRRALEEHRMIVCAEAGTASAAVEAVLREHPEVCLLDLDLPGAVITSVAVIATEAPGTGVVMLTAAREDPRLFEALCAGAAGHLPKDMDPARLPVALPRVLEGDERLPRSIVAKVIDEFRERQPQQRFPFRKERSAELTPREWEVLELLRGGLTTAEIAQRLFISQATVRTHVASILKKLSVPDRNAAIRLADNR